MNKIVPFKKFSKKSSMIPSGSSVIMNEDNIPSGFVFSTDAFISLCTIIDEEFEKNVKDPAKAFNNPAGKLIDLIEGKLPINPEFAKELKVSIQKTKKKELISLEEISHVLNV
jgi:hypothetical protein